MPNTHKIIVPYKISDRDRAAITPQANGLIPEDNLVYGQLFTLAGGLLKALEEAEARAAKAEATVALIRTTPATRGPRSPWRGTDVEARALVQDATSTYKYLPALLRRAIAHGVRWGAYRDRDECLAEADRAEYGDD